MLKVIGLVVGFAFLILMIYLKVDFGKAILGASAILLVFSEPSSSALYWVLNITREYETLRLMAIITQIGFLGFIYKDSRQVIRMIKKLKMAFPKQKIVIAAIPAIFGLMPMPGGALVSAPMIDDEGDRLNLDGTEKTFLNWWFRHIWFTVYPLSMGLILTSSLSGVSIYKIALFNLPIFAAHITIGVFWGLKKIDIQKTSASSINFSLLVYDLLPIIIALSLNILFAIPLYVTLFLAIITLILQNRNRYKLGEIPATFKSGFSFDLMIAAYGIMLFKGIIERAGSIAPLIEGLEGHIPLLVMVLGASYLVGLLFGHLPGAVGIGFPVLLPLLPVINFQTVSLIFIFIFLGYFTSPIHLCIILTIEYFETGIKRFYKRMFIPLAVLVISIITWLFITGTFFMFS